MSTPLEDKIKPDGLVSILILANHRPELLGNAIKSALNQDYPHIEILILQDSYDALVRDKALLFAATDSRVKYSRNPHPGNIAEASNFGLSLCAGEFVAILDDDDEWALVSKTRLQVKFLNENQDHVAIGGGVIVVDGGGNEIVRYRKAATDNMIRQAALRANPLANSATIFRKSAWVAAGRYDEKIGNFHDWEFWLRIGTIGRLANLSEFVLLYRLWDNGSSWVQLRENAKAARRIVRRYRDVYPGYFSAMTLALGYSVYATLPKRISKPSYLLLSSLKKRWSGMLPSRRYRNSPSIEAFRCFEAARSNLESTSDTDRLPSVTIAIPARNEAHGIGALLQTIRTSRYKHIIEILVVDGGSDDETRTIAASLSELDARIRIVDNPDKIVSAGLNKAFGVSRGDVFLRMDVHAEYNDDYIESCINTMVETGADNVGGAQRFIAKNNFQLCVAIAARTIFGSGGARYRSEDYEGPSDTVYLGCFKRNALLRVQLPKSLHAGILNGPSDDYPLIFSAINVTNQDAELNARLRKFGLVFQSRKIVANYYPRETLGPYSRQYFRYGRGRMITTLLHRQVVVRGNTPFIVFWTLTGLVCVAVITGMFEIPVVAIAGLLCLILLDSIFQIAVSFASIRARVWKGERCPAGVITRLIMVPMIIVTANVAHALGFCYQGWRVAMRRKLEW